MMYALFRLIFKISGRLYFKTFQVKGAENIPEKGPVFLVANHPSGFMDPIVIGILTGRPLFFLAKGALFQSKFSRWILSVLHVIPVFRGDETPGYAEKNEKIFSLCYKHFAKGGAILAFPEGISLTERKIKKIKTGAARICLGAEAENNFKLDVKIVTIGLNFSDPHKFQSDLFINIDTPIHVSDYYELYRQDNYKAVQDLTDEIRRRIEMQVVAIQDSNTDKLVSDIEKIYKSELLQDSGHSAKELERDFTATRAISESVHYFMESDKERVERLKREIDSYLNRLEHLSLNDNAIKGIGKSSSSPFFDAAGSLLYLILGFPVFIFGFFNNYLPYRIPSWSAQHISRRPELYGSIAMSLGTFTFLVFYALQIWIINTLSNDWLIALLYGIMLPVSGLFAFYYYKRFTSIRGNWKVFSLFYKKTTLITSLISKRQSIINELKKGKEDFNAHRNKSINSPV